MSVKDVIKQSVYESLGGGTNLSVPNIAVILMISCLLGVYLFGIYKTTSKAAFYSKDLNITIAGMPIIVSAIMIAMQSNLLVSLGMVGALSIVRFRSAVKNPLDLLYLFWSISAGIIAGVGLTVLAILLCIIMTALLIMLETLPNMKASELLILHIADREFNGNVLKGLLKEHTSYCKEKSRSICNGEVEIIFEVRTKEIEELLSKIGNREGVRQVNYLKHDGEYRG